MRHELLGIILSPQSVLGVPVEKALDEVPAFSTECIPWEAYFAKRNVLVHLLRVLRIEWAPSAAHLENKHT